MKKLLVLALVLSLASIANAGLTLGISKDSLQVSETAVISISGDDMGASGTPTQDQDYFFIGLGDGPASLNIDNATIVYPGSAVEMALMEDDLGIGLPFFYVSLTDPVSPPATPALLIGLLVDGIVMHCDGPGDVTVTLYNSNLDVLDSVVITQPEPITIGLLGLGAMFLRRRK